MRIELKVVLSVTGKTVCKEFNGRKAIGWPRVLVVAEGTGAPERKKREPIAPGAIGLIAGHTLPSFGDVSGLVPVRPVLLPLEAKKAYARAPQMFAATPVPTSVFTKVACGGVKPANVRATGLIPGITG